MQQNFNNLIITLPVSTNVEAVIDGLMFLLGNYLTMKSHPNRQISSAKHVSVHHSIIDTNDVVMI